MILPDLTRPESLLQQTQSPSGDDADKFQTFGPSFNEASTQIVRNGAAHNIIVLDRTSSDVSLGHSARVSAFYRRLQEAPVVRPAARETREVVLRTESRTRAATPTTVVLVAPATFDATATAAVPLQIGSQFGIAGFGTESFGA